MSGAERGLIRVIESAVQATIRNGLINRGYLVFRCNVGEGWTGESVRLPSGDVLIHNPRRFSTGLPKGFPDLMAMSPTGTVGFIEVKTQTGRVRPEQTRCHETFRARGVRCGVARSIDDAIKIMEGSNDIADA